MAKWTWDWQHVVIVVAALAAVTATIIAGKGDALVSLLAALGGGTTILALLKTSPMGDKENSK